MSIRGVPEMNWFPESPGRIRLVVYPIFALSAIAGMIWGRGSVWRWLILAFGIGVLIALAHRYARSTMPPRG